MVYQMEVKKWTYEEFPEYQDERFRSIDTDGNDIGVVYLNDVEYVNMDGVPLHLQIMMPYCRNQMKGSYPCMVYVQGSGWKKQHIHAGRGPTVYFLFHIHSIQFNELYQLV